MIKSKIDNKKSRYKEIVEEKRNALKAITSNFYMFIISGLDENESLNSSIMQKQIELK